MIIDKVKLLAQLEQAFRILLTVTISDSDTSLYQLWMCTTVNTNIYEKLKFDQRKAM